MQFRSLIKNGWLGGWLGGLLTGVSKVIRIGESLWRPSEAQLGSTFKSFSSRSQLAIQFWNSSHPSSHPAGDFQTALADNVLISRFCSLSFGFKKFEWQKMNLIHAIWLELLGQAKGPLVKVIHFRLLRVLRIWVLKIRVFELWFFIEKLQVGRSQPQAPIEFQPKLQRNRCNGNLKSEQF